jgi:hypothetical protein
MYNASDLFKRAISSPNRDLRLRCTIDGTVYTETDLQDCSIEESILTSNDFKLGSATASSFEITLLNMDESLSAKSFEGKEVSIEIGAVLDKFSRPVEYVSMGKFIVENPSKEKKTIKISGYDKMILFEKPYVSSLTYPATLSQILHEVCTIAGVELETITFLNSDYIITEKPNLDNVTLRMALEFISELSASYASINRSGKVQLITFTNTDLEINTSNYYSMKLSEFEYGGSNKVVINNEGVVKEVGNGTNVIEIKDNIFAINPTDQLINNIAQTIKNFKFKPFTTTWQGNVLTAPGDVITVSYSDGEAYKSFIAKQKFTFSNGLKCDIATESKTGIQTEYQSGGAITQKIEKTKNELKSKIEQTEDKILLEVEEVGKSVASLQLEADNINLKVEELDKSVGQISVKANEIDLSVKSLDERVGNAQSQLNIQADQISTKVEKDGIISAIVQSPETIKFSASKIELDGITQVNGNVELGKGWEPGGANGEKSITFSNAGKISYHDGFRYQASTFGHLFVGDVTIQSDYRLNLTGVQVIGLNVTASFG